MLITKTYTSHSVNWWWLALAAQFLIACTPPQDKLTEPSIKAKPGAIGTGASASSDLNLKKASEQERSSNQSNSLILSLNPKTPTVAKSDESKTANPSASSATGAGVQAQTDSGSSVKPSPTAPTNGATTSSATTIDPDQSPETVANELKKSGLNANLISVQMKRPDLAEAVVADDPRVITEGSIDTESRTLTVINDNRNGAFCKSEITGRLEKFSTYTLKSLRWGDSQNNAIGLRALRLKYSNSANSIVALNCEVHESFDMPMMNENIEMVFSLKKADGKFPTPDEVEADDDPRAIYNKTLSFKVANEATLRQLNTPNESDDLIWAINDGKLIAANEGEQMVYSARSKMSCQVNHIDGPLNGASYKREQTESKGFDQQKGVAMMEYRYKANNSQAIVFTCVMRRNAPSAILFDVFSNVFDFGK